MKIRLLQILLPLTLLIVASCGPGKDRVRLEGSLKNISNAEFYVYSEDGTFDGIDTIRIEDGHFTYERKLTEPTLLTLLYPNFTQTYVVAEPGKTVKMKGDAARLSEAEVTGTDQNNLLTDFRLDVLNRPAGNAPMAASQFIRDHASTLAAVAVYRKYYTSQQRPDVQMALQLLDVLKKAQPKSRSVQYLVDFYRPIFENGVGRNLPAFTAETLDGRNISSADYRGKRLVIVCVGSWQNKSKEFMRILRGKIKNAKQSWECVVVSMDLDRQMVCDQIRTDSISFPVVCDRKAFESPLVQQLGLRYVPSCMLVDTRGIIVQRDVTNANEVQIR